MEILDFVYLKIIDAFDGVSLSKPLVIKPIIKQKNPDVKYENYVLLQDMSSVLRNAGFGGYRTKQIAVIRCDIRSNDVVDFKLMSRKVLDTFKGSNSFAFVIDEENSTPIAMDTEIENYEDYTENITIVTLVDENPFIGVGDTVEILYGDGRSRYMYVWKVDGRVLTLFGTEGIIYYTQVVGEENLSDKRRGLYRRLIDVEVRAYL